MLTTFPIGRVATFLTAAALVAVMGCSSSEETTPTPIPPTPTIGQVPLPVLPTATATATAVPPGVTAVPVATSTPTPAPLPGEEPLYGGTIVTADQTQPGLSAVESSDWNWWPTNHYNQLIRLKPSDRVTVEGDLAQSWSLSDDGTEWTFKIRPGVLNHEGDPFTVDDVYYQMFRYIEQPGGAPAVRQSCLRAFVNKILDENGNVLPIPGVEITGSDELTIRLVAPRTSFVGCITAPSVVFSPSKYTKQIDSSGEYRDLDQSQGEVIGTGPFKVIEIRLDNSTELERFDQYFREGRPYLDALRTVVIPDAATRVAAFRVGRIDAFPPFPAVRKRDADALKEALGDEIVNPVTVAMGFRGADVNVQRPPFGPVGDTNADNIRWAMQISLDRNEINTLTADGLGFLSTPYFFLWAWIYTQEEWLEQFRGLDADPGLKAQDVAEAQRLMQLAGYGPTNRLEATAVASPGINSNIAEAAAQQWKAIYIDVDVIATRESRDIAAAGDFDLLFQGVGAPFADPDAFNTTSYLPRSEGGFNFTGWTNPRWQELFEEQVVLERQEDRAPLLREMAKILYTDATKISVIRRGLIQPHRGNWRGWVPPFYHSQTYTLESVWLTQ